MVSLGYLGEAKVLNLSDDIIKMLIVRKPVSGIPSGFHHLPMLSPSSGLFDLTRRWKQNIFSEKEKEKLKLLNIDIEASDAWWYLYKPEFKKELRNREDVNNGIRVLSRNLKRGKEVFLFCYCKDLCRCHRLLVGEYLEELGAKVNFRREEKEEEDDKIIQLNLFNK